MNVSGDYFQVKRTSIAFYFLLVQTTQIGGMLSLLSLVAALALVDEVFLLSLLFFMGAIALPIVYVFTIGKWLSERQAHALRYWLDGATLRVDEGVYFLKRKAIPLDRITDVVLAQGPLLRHCEIWALHIQTAGMSGQMGYEATLLGLTDPEGIRDRILQARDAARGLAKQPMD